MCKPYLLGCCPHDLLASSKFDIGPCGKIHDPYLKQEYSSCCVILSRYEKDPNSKYYHYEDSLRLSLREQVRHCDRRIQVVKWSEV